jgi:hypothetical protein
MLRRVALVRTDVSEELGASFIRMTIDELGRTLAAISNRHALRRNTCCWQTATYSFCKLASCFNMAAFDVYGVWILTRSNVVITKIITVLVNVLIVLRWKAS